jgi:DNA-binding response OmpR family regulator
VAAFREKPSTLSPPMSAQATAENSQRTRILVIDDDKKLCRLIADYLTPMGYEVSLVHTGPGGVEKATNESWSAIILDVMLPGMDGFEVLKQIRKSNDVPVLMLTARGDEADRIVGLEIGADDYLPKTFSTRELLARLRAVMRRSTRTTKTNDDGREAEVVVGKLRVDPNTRTAVFGARPRPREIPRAVAGRNSRPQLRSVRPLHRRPHFRAA